jgi:DNA-directed RNA polymerase specialized sigma24 family protein
MTGRTRVMINSMTDQRPTPNLTDIAGYTSEIRNLQDQRAVKAEQRRKAVIRHHGNGVSLAEMARAMGVSEAAVNKMVHSGPSQRAAARAKTLPKK